MSDDLIRVQPARALRTEFAAWAVSQWPKLRTVSSTEFGVPTGIYTHMPEELLVGSLVEGHPYEAVEDAPEVWGQPDQDGLDAGAPPESSDTWPGTAPEPEPASEEPEGPSPADGDADTVPPTESAGRTTGRPVVCRAEGCGREFPTMRELHGHRRQDHPKPTAESGG